MKPQLIQLHIANYFTLLFSLVLTIAPSVMEAQIQGKVYRDFNANGVFDSTATFKEIGLSGIIVTAYNTAGTSIGTATTNSTGNYTITGITGTVRVEFTGLGTGDYSGPRAASGTNFSNTSVQFVTTPTTAVSFGVNYPSDYCQTNPTYFTSCYINGKIGNTSVDVEPAYVSFPSTSTGTTPAPTKIATIGQVGALWGTGFHKKTSKILSGAVLRRHSDLPPNGSGAIYKLDPTGVSAPSLFLNLTSLGISTGSNPRTASGTCSLSNSPTTPNRDACAFPLVGKMALGDIDVSNDDKTLWVVSLNDRKVYGFNLDATLSTPTSIKYQFALPSSSCGNGGVFRPWAVAEHRGKLYVGGVCTAEGYNYAALANPFNYPQNADLRGIVYSIDPNAAIPTFVSELSIDLNYTRNGKPARDANGENARWHPWVDNYSVIRTAYGTYASLVFAQPILSDIVFDESDNMLLGFIDRFSMQGGSFNYAPDLTTDNTQYEYMSAGDLLKACKSGSGWVLESGGACTGRTASTNQANSQGPGGGEFFWSDQAENSGGVFPPTDPVGAHEENILGGLNYIMGTQEVSSTVYDPLTAPRLGGVRWFNNTDGSTKRGYVIVNTNAVNNPATMGKSLDVGDLDVACALPPIEIGNRVWTDTDRDGIQDAGEVGISGLTVDLYKGATKVGTTTTNANGEYYFNSTNVNLSGVSGLKSDSIYQIRIAKTQAAITSLEVTSANINSNGSDMIDNDAVLSGTNAVVDVTIGGTGQNNHALDFGFKAPCDTTLTVSNTTICNGSSVNLFSLASGVKGTLTYSTNGTTWTALTSPTNVTPSVTTTYYIKDTLVSGCFDIDTLVITVNPQPTTPSVSSPIMNICPLTTVDLTTISSALTPSVSGGVFEWRVSNSSSSAMVSNQSAVGAGDYYLFEKSPAGCYSTGLKVTTTINVCCPPKVCLPVTVTRNN